MKCPFCGNDISNNTVYCPSCGQTVQNASNEASVNNYWKDNNAAITKADKDQKARERASLSANLLSVGECCPKVITSLID